MEKKTTKKEMFAQIIVDLQNKEVENKEEKIAFLEKQIELVSKKRTNNKKTEENEVIAEKIVEARKGQTIRASQLINTIEGIENTSKATSILGVLCKSGRAKQYTEKGVSFYEIF